MQGPQTETDLLQSRPASNRPGTFPAELLVPGERVLFETRPGLLGLYWGRLTMVLLLDLLFLGVSIELVTNPAGWFFVGLFTLLIVYWVLVWQRAAYAITDRRIVRVAGLRQNDFMDALYDQVHNLRLEPGFSGGLKFDATPPRGPTRVLGGSKYAKTIYWRALPDSARVYEFVQAAFSLHATVWEQQARRDELVAAVTADRFPCSYCGTLVDIRTIDRASPKCPSCGAPLVPPDVQRSATQVYSPPAPRPAPARSPAGPSTPSGRGR